MDDVSFEKLIKVCRLKLSDEEKNNVKKDINEILAYFDTIDSVETDGVKEAFHPILIPEKTREDEVKQFDETDLLLKNTRMYRFYVLGPVV